MGEAVPGEAVPGEAVPGEAVVDLRSPRRIHVVGVGGTGMSAIATVLVGMGHRVSGSDIAVTAAVDRLRHLGVDVTIGHDPSVIGGAELVTASSAVPSSNIELGEARRLGVPVLPRSQILAAICATRQSVAVAGTHGKTTTSSMLALILREAGMHPSFVIGGDINQLGSGALWDPDGAWLVVEADESDGTFLELGAQLAVVTSVEPDHLDFYGGLGPMQAAYRQFLAGTPGARVVCADDPVAAGLGEQVGDVITYGTSPGAHLRMVDLQLTRDQAHFGIQRAGVDLGRIGLAVPGLHNARNAAGALTVALELGASFDAASRALARYGGVARRFEFRGERHGVTFVDDYGHLPTEVRSVLAAARVGDWGRVVAVFQPHRYSRTAALWADFADSFVDADVILVTEVYPAGEAPIPGVSGRLIADAIIGAHPDARVTYLPGHRELVDALRELLGPGDLCLTLGAGDLTNLPGELLGIGR